MIGLFWEDRLEPLNILDESSSVFVSFFERDKRLIPNPKIWGGVGRIQENMFLQIWKVFSKSFPIHLSSFFFAFSNDLFKVGWSMV